MTDINKLDALLDEKLGGANTALDTDFDAAVEQKPIRSRKRRVSVTPVEEPADLEQTVSTMEHRPVDQELIEQVQQQAPKHVQPAPKTGISDTFDNLMQQFATDAAESAPVEVKPEEIKHDASKLLANITVDLNSINIVEGPAKLNLLKSREELLGASKVMQVVCCQSAYSAEVSALRNQEIQNINNMNVDTYTFKRKLYHALWNHIENTSVGKMDFDTWMRVTSIFDVETLLYGAYSMTFPHENKYPLQCPVNDCQRKFDAIINNNSLVETRGQNDIFAKISEVVSNIDNAAELIGQSHVHTTKRIMLPESKIIVDVHIPSVHDYLEGSLLKFRNNEQYAEENAESLGLAMFVKQFLIPDIETLRNTGQLQYMALTDRDVFADTIANLPIQDAQYIPDGVDEMADKLQITYSIKGIKCPQCGYEFKPIPMNMESLLFIAIRMVRNA